MRYGLMELTMLTGSVLPISCTRRMPSSKLPRICSTIEPCIIACESLPSAILRPGRRTKQALPPGAAWAAAEAEVLPVEAQMIARAPSSPPRVTAIVMPRPLNEPVGFRPSNLARTRTRLRTSRGRFSSSMSGVAPSLSEIARVSAATGRRSRYLSISPVYIDSSKLLETDAGNLADHHGQLFHLADRRIHVFLDRQMGKHDDVHLVLPFVRLLLDHRVDGDLALGQYARDVGEHPRLVLDAHAQIVGRLDLAHRQDRSPGQPVGLECEMGYPMLGIGRQRARDVHQVRHDGRSGRLGSRPPALVHRLPDSIALAQSALP